MAGITPQLSVDSDYACAAANLRLANVCETSIDYTFTAIGDCNPHKRSWRLRLTTVENNTPLHRYLPSNPRTQKITPHTPNN